MSEISEPTPPKRRIRKTDDFSPDASLAEHQWKPETEITDEDGNPLDPYEHIDTPTVRGQKDFLEASTVAASGQTEDDATPKADDQSPKFGEPGYYDTLLGDE